MAFKLGQFEVRDTKGTTSHFNGTVGTSSTAVPSSPGSVISQAIVKQPASDSANKILSVSFDGGTNWYTLEPGLSLTWPVKGALTQIHIKGNVASTGYEIILNREPNT